MRVIENDADVKAKCDFPTVLVVMGSGIDTKYHFYISQKCQPRLKVSISRLL